MDSEARTLANLIARTPSLRRSLVIAAALSMFASAAEITVVVALVPILASIGVDAGNTLDGTIAMFPPTGWLVMFAFLAATRSILNWLTAVRTEHGQQELVIHLQSRLYRAMAAAHWDAVRRISPAQLTSALHTQAYDAGYAFSSAIGLITTSVLVAGYLLSSALVFPLALPALILVLVIVWRLNARRAAQVFSRSEDYHESQTDLHQRYEDWISISRIAALGIDSDQLANRFEADAKAAASHAVGFSRSYAATRASYEGAVVATILVGVPVAWWLETPPALLAFGLVLLVRVLPQAAGIHNSYLGVANAEAPTRNIEDLIRELERDPARHFYDGTSLQWQCLELANVSVGDQLRSQGDEPILQNVSLTLDHGEWLALHGPTGAGKTTLADVMLMLLRPGAGVIRIDGAEVDEETASRWREQSAYVPQDVVLFDASIRENLTLCAPETSDAVLEAALRRSAAEFVVDRLPEGLSTRAGPGGRWLSGGERQRIGIARALLKKPGFLVLDEPTAALDAGTQAKLMQALSELEHTMSVLLITHRPELLELADRVIELEDGTISD